MSENINEVIATGWRRQSPQLSVPQANACLAATFCAGRAFICFT